MNPDVKVKLQEGRKQGSRKSKKAVYELSVLGETQFDVVDKFDMFENPHDVDEITE